MKHFEGKVAVITGGASGIGTHAIQVAHALGARVAVTASLEKLELCRELGADILINYRDEDFVERVGEWTDDDLTARWIDLSDDEGTTYAQVCVSMESEGLGNDTYRSSLDTGGCFAIRGFNVVDDEDHEGFTSPIDENVTLNIGNQTEAFSFVRDPGVLCEAIVDAVRWLIETHEEQVRLDRERREREADNDVEEDEED